MSKGFWRFKPLDEWGSKARKEEEHYRNQRSETQRVIDEQLDEGEPYLTMSEAWDKMMSEDNDLYVMTLILMGADSEVIEAARNSVTPENFVSTPEQQTNHDYKKD